jgi:hypothetical protein
MKKITITLYIITLYLSAYAQMPHDAIYMMKKSICSGLMYSNTSWTKYWEGGLFRDNPNIGKNVTQSYNFMAAYGVTNKLNMIVNVPYISTHNSKGNLMGQQGLQDISIFIKYKALDKKDLSLHGVIGGSVPMRNYVPDFLPMSIGLGCKTAMARIIADYQLESGFYLTMSGSYHLRSNITLDKDSYQAYGKVYNTNEVQMPNTIDAALRLGYLKNKIQAEAFYTYSSCTSGDNIRRNDMPFPTNNMQASQIGIYGKYQPKSLGFMTQVAYTLDGLNVGRSLMYMAGLSYQLNFHH